LQWLWKQAVSTAATLPRSCGAADGKSVVPAAAVELFGIDGVSNVANATKEFKRERRSDPRMNRRARDRCRMGR
jgi:hypothetical protein